MKFDSDLQPGIRGDLILPTAAIFLAPGSLIRYADAFHTSLDEQIVAICLDSSHPAHDVKLALLFHVQTKGFGGVAIACIFLLWPLFFLRHRYFPVAFAFVAMATVTLLLFRLWLIVTNPAIQEEMRGPFYGQTAIWGAFALVLGIYMLRSRRAMITFCRKLVFFPVYPFVGRV